MVHFQYVSLQDVYKGDTNMAKGERIFLKLRTSDLCRLFYCSPDTLRRWIRLGRIDPRSIEDIIEKYNNPNVLDKRRSLPVDTVG
jgi:hypothetical protein